MSESLQPSRKLPPTDRDFEIYEAVHIRHQSTWLLADRHRISQTRVRQIVRAWQLAFSRSPTVLKLADALEFMSRQVDHLKIAGEKEALETKDLKKDEKTRPATKPAPELQALTDLCQALLSANEFLYVD